MKSKRPNFELLAELHAIVDGIPDERFHLDEMLTLRGNKTPAKPIDAHNCATVGCALGWASLHPKFQALGLRYDGTEFTAEFTIDRQRNLSYDEVGARLFNITHGAAVRLFCPAVAVGMPRSRSDKEIFKQRVREFFIANGQRVRKRNAA